MNDWLLLAYAFWLIGVLTWGAEAEIRRRNMTTEHALKNRCTAWLRTQRWIYFLKVHGSQYQRAGVADYWLVIDGHSVQVELKAPGNPPTGSVLQEAELRKHARVGGSSYVVTSFEAFKAVAFYHRGQSIDLGIFEEKGQLREVVP